jgi:hypothetical protein
MVRKLGGFGDVKKSPTEISTTKIFVTRGQSDPHKEKGAFLRKRLLPLPYLFSTKSTHGNGRITRRYTFTSPSLLRRTAKLLLARGRSGTKWR